MNIRRLVSVISHSLMMLALCALAINASAATASNSLLASGRWVKIKVKESGMHQITFDQLRQWGFNRPERVAIYGFPAVELSSYTLTPDRLDDLQPVPCSIVDGKLVFYGSGDVELEAVNGNLPTGYNTGTYAAVKRNYYADFGTYFLTDSHHAEALLDIAYTGPKYEDSYTNETDIITMSKAMSLYEQELQNEAKIGARFWDEFIPDGGQKTYNIPMPGFDPAGGKVNMLLYVGHCVQSSGTQRIVMPSGNESSALYLSKQNSTEMWLYGQSVMVYDNDKDATKLAKTDDDLYPVTIAKDKSGSFTIDYISALYPVNTALDGRAQAMFTISDIKATDVLKVAGNAGSEMQVWDVTEPQRPRCFTTEAAGTSGDVWISSPGNYNSSVSSSATHQFARFVAFDPKRELMPVEFDGEVANQNLHGMTVPHMLIITASDFVDQANRLAEIHRSISGIDVAVVTQEEVYNEFSSGTPMIMAFRSLARHLYDRDASKFRSVLLIGATHWDNRYLYDDAEAFRRTNIPMFLCEQGDGVGSYPLSYKTDAFIGMLKDNKGKLDFFNADMCISVGRIPAPSVADVTSYIDKVEKYLTNPPSPEIYNTILVASDEGDRNGHLDDANQLGTDVVALAPGTTFLQAANSLYPYVNGAAQNVNNKINDALARGVAFMSFNGHALSTFALGTGYVWDVTKVGATSYSTPPLVFLATCNAVDPSQSTKSISEAMLSKTDGGAIAVISACRSVFMEENQYLGREVVEKIYLPRPNATMGTVMMDAHNGLIVDSPSSSFRNRAMANRLAFNLYGDPEIPVVQTSHYVVVTDVNGVETSPKGVVNVDADSMLKIEGDVVDANGNIATDFSGDLRINLYDSPLILPVINATGTYLNQKVSLDEDVLVEHVVKVVNGHFSAEFYVPTPRDATSNRLQFYAESNGRVVRDGWNGLVVIPSAELSSDPSEANAPVITEMYINSPNFSNGDVINGAGSTLFARVEANPYGLVGKNSTPGKALRVLLDDCKSLSYASYGFNVDSDGEGFLEFPLPEISDGLHSITLSVSNNIGQSASASLSFVVVNEPLDARLVVEESPARHSATITIDGIDSGSAQGHLVVRDAAGNAVHKADNPTFPYSWNLLDAESNPVPAGFYTVEAYIRAGNAYGSATPCPIVVHY